MSYVVRRDEYTRILNSNVDFSFKLRGRFSADFKSCVGHINLFFNDLLLGELFEVNISTLILIYL